MARAEAVHRDLGGLSITPCREREGDSRNPMMNDWKKSDSAMVPKKAANKGPSESLEGRAGPKGNAVGQRHYMLDDWLHDTWRKRMAEGDTIIVRHADDLVCGFQHQGAAVRFLQDLGERLDHHGLERHPDKTRLIAFDRFASENRRKQGQGKPETFDFLGMTHFCDQSRKGKFRVGRKPSRKRLRRTLRRIKEELRKRWHDNRRFEDVCQSACKVDPGS
ncbi:MAG: hypothetical protein OXC93_12945, partial [Rhodospirillaceae bacterium]|nr:hypothetical protein [Rhodospirillaceae bacterium]